MSSGILDKSLDDSIANNRQASRRTTRGRANRRTAAKPAAVGGVKKNTKAAKAAGQSAQNVPSAPSKESKIMVSGLPSDVNEGNIKTFEAQLLPRIPTFTTPCHGFYRCPADRSSFMTPLRVIYWLDVKREKLSNVLVLQRAYPLKWMLVHPLASYAAGCRNGSKGHPSRTYALSRHRT
ncbi:hypothetical protein PHISP_03610 [Aspergillus sp. HF37]|nr:hypothetical protein PHISP_03610 [Aspergillus sp. HF37]